MCGSGRSRRYEGSWWLFWAEIPDWQTTFCIRCSSKLRISSTHGRWQKLVMTSQMTFPWHQITYCWWGVIFRIPGVCFTMVRRTDVTGNTHRILWRFSGNVGFGSIFQKRQKWLGIKSNLKVGDLVLVMDENAPRGLWPLGLIQEVSVGRDGLVRSARLKTVTSVLSRPITKLVSLECDV